MVVQTRHVSRNYKPTVYWYGSFRCNLRCRHCWVDSSPFVDCSSDLSTAEALETVRQLKELDASVILTGGEFLFRPDAPQLLEALIDARVPIGLETNGLMFNSETVRVLCKARALNQAPDISISVDGGTREAHEWMRGHHTFDKTLDGMRLLKGNEIPFAVQCILHRRNYKTIPDLYRAMLAFAPQPMRLSFGFLTPFGRGLQMSEEFSMTAALIDEACGMIVEGKKNYPSPVTVKLPPAMIPPHYFPVLFGGGANYSCATTCSFPTLGVLPNGNISICALTRNNPGVLFGNVRKDTLAGIWQKIKVDVLRESYMAANLTGICGDCIFANICKGSCRAHAYDEFGDFSAPYPICDAVYHRGEFPTVYRLSHLAGNPLAELPPIPGLEAMGQSTQLVQIHVNK